MRFTRPPAWALAFVCVGLSALAQAPRLQFLSRLKEGATVSGVVTLKVSSDPILRPRGIQVGIEIDGELKETAASLPWSYSWNSDAAPDGKHVIRLVLVNTRTRETGTVDEMRVNTLNRQDPIVRQMTRQEEKPAPDTERRREAEPSETRKRDERVARRDDDAKPDRGRFFDPQPEKRATIGSQPRDAEVLRAANALEFSPCSLQVESGKLLIGRRDSSLTVFDPASKDGWTVRAPEAAGEVLSAARTEGISCWLCADAGADKTTSATPARWLFVYHESERKVASYDLTSSPTPARRVALWRGQAVLTGAAGGCLLDTRSGELRDLDALAPADIADKTRGAELFFAVSGDRAVLAALGRGSRYRTAAGPTLAPGEIAVWTASGDRWVQADLPGLADAGVENVRMLAATTERLGLILNSGAAGVSFGRYDQTQRVDDPRSDQTGRMVTQASLSGRHLWRLRGSTLLHVDLENGRQDAFLPWNTPGFSPKTIAADGDTVWIGGGQGIRRLDLTRPDPQTGYAGFVRARLGGETDQANAERDQRLAQAIDAWQGTPYLWGGESRNGVDCSGFVMKAFQEVGVRLDHGSDYLRSCRQGMLVKDELRYGDVLVFPGHCAIYTGDGTTAETVDKAVGRASIWRRGEVVVRRFLGAAAIETQEFASRSGGYGRSTRRKSSARKKSSNE